MSSIRPVFHASSEERVILLSKAGSDLCSGPLREMWSTPIDLYCERVTPFFWGEPVSALSNISFLIAAFVALDRWRRKAKGDGAILALIVVVATVGLGSFAFHTVATRAAMTARHHADRHFHLRVFFARFA